MPFELAPNSYDARWAIITNAAAKLGFAVDRDFFFRIVGAGKILGNGQRTLREISSRLLKALYRWR
jgi:hypothetical protein